MKKEIKKIIENYVPAEKMNSTVSRLETLFFKENRRNMKGLQDNFFEIKAKANQAHLLFQKESVKGWWYKRLFWVLVPSLSLLLLILAL